jgi:hypothetical protein
MIKNVQYVGLLLHVQCRYCWQGLMKLELSHQSFEKYSNIKSHYTPSGGSRVVPRGRTDGRTVRQT